MIAEHSLSPEVLFTGFVQKVEIEISAACNRRCDYCPQSAVRRRQALMPLPLFKRIILELKALGYSKELAFHQYNEPLLAPAHFLDCDDTVQAYLPSARKVLHTNGDLLTKEILGELVRREFALIIVTLHLHPGETWSREGSIEKLRNFSEKIQILDTSPFDSLQPGESAPASITANIGKTTLHVIAADFGANGSTRIGAVSIRAPEKKTKPEIKLCPNILHQVSVAYEGTSYLCCDCCHDFPAHAPYALGTIHDFTLLELFQRKFTTYTKEYLFGNIPKPCRICMPG